MKDSFTCQTVQLFSMVMKSTFATSSPSLGPAVASSSPSDGILQTDLNAWSCYSKQACSSNGEYQLLNVMWNSLINNKKKANSQEKHLTWKLKIFPNFHKNVKKYINTEQTLLLDGYRVCRGFRLTKQVDYFWVNFDHFWSKRHFLRQLGQLQKLAWA